MLSNQQCFCGADQSFSSCCQPFINRETNQKTNLLTFPETPEQLMRSRFSAYVTGNSQYIYDTYAKSSQASQSVKEIDEWSKACTWIALEIHSTSPDNTDSKVLTEQFVEFSAFYISDDTLCELRENSRFVLEAAICDGITGDGTGEENTSDKNNTEIDHQALQWRYIDGDIINHSELATIKRKDLCPCNNYPTSWSVKKGKKFKQCCAK